MSEINKLMSLIKEGEDMFSTSDLIVEAFKDLTKDEIKERIKQKIEENPELKKEIKAAVTIYMEAKAKEMYAGLRLAKCAARLGLDMMPENVREQMIKEFSVMFEREMQEIFERAV